MRPRKFEGVKAISSEDDEDPDDASDLQNNTKEVTEDPIYIHAERNSVSSASVPTLQAGDDLKDRAKKLCDNLQMNATKYEEHVAIVKDTFAFQGYIQRTEHRAITVDQLLRILRFIESECNNWKDTSPAHISAMSGQTLHAAIVNLYHFNTWCILPGTNEKNCAFVELLTSQVQKPTFFCSHWWGEAVQDFVACVQEHASLRHFSEDTAFWVCAYANRQHSLNEELVLNPMETSFYRAMKLSEGVLLILDGEATAFTRIWCAFEESVALTDKNRASPMLLDIATRSTGQVAILTDGPAASDAEQYSWAGGAQYAQSQRQSRFPGQVLEAGARVRVQLCEASVKEDRIHILNCIAGCGLEDEPLTEHEAYDRVNGQLSAIFATAQLPLEKEAAGIDLLLKIIFEDRWTSKMHLCLPRQTNDITILGKGLAQLGQLQQLTLHLQYTQVNDVTELGKGLAHLTQLQQFTLILANTQVNDVTELGKGLARLKHLQQLLLHLRSTQVNDVTELGKGLAQIKQLQQLTLNLWSTQVNDVMELGKGLAHLKQLQQLKLHLSSTQVNDVTELGKSLAHLTQLQEFKLWLNETQLNDVTELGKGLGHFTQIQKLTLYLNETKVNDVSDLGRSLARLTKLKQLTLHLMRTQVSDASELGKGLTHLSQLQKLDLDLCHTQVEDVTELGKGLARLTQLKELILRLHGTKVNDVMELGKGLAHLEQLKQLTLQHNGGDKDLAWVQQFKQQH